MGYTTEFSGEFKIDKKLDDNTYKLLKGLAQTRRMKRKTSKEYGTDGEFYYNEKDFDNCGQAHEEDIIDYNTPPSTQPSLGLQWLIQEDRYTIKWDGGEKFYSYTEWIGYIMDKILIPRGYTLSGEVSFQGEEKDDYGIIKVKNNIITIE